MGLSRREFLVATGTSLASLLLPEVRPVWSEPSVEYALPKLPYPYDALEPFIDEATMKLHHDKHFKAYLDKFNAVLPNVKNITEPTTRQLELALESLDAISDPKDRATVRNNAGGYYNHTVFFETMSQAASTGEQRKATGRLATDIVEDFGSFDEFKAQFTSVATSHFGSGWAWLYRDRLSGRLQIKSYPNQDSPLLEGHKPILGCDVWEHAYYLQYNNRRPDYVKAWWNVVNWDAVAARAY